MLRSIRVLVCTVAAFGASSLCLAAPAKTAPAKAGSHVATSVTTRPATIKKVAAVKKVASTKKVSHPTSKKMARHTVKKASKNIKPVAHHTKAKHNTKLIKSKAKHATKLVKAKAKHNTKLAAKTTKKTAHAPVHAIVWH